ncbi:transcriptional regulator BolA [Psychrosphaera ytuae]|uniref:DNA-binding transcriptional regulator BolA n=1 Tax=Psychrosphaera ytuae TaxID=2820710 RepID=A0A975DDX6_9GAMM|nr:transcriptional regulator BolA [Psychrosphaera ytuae]QTH65390.1 transcriptional regulator BolA [Psychrosphaera ytuae]
MIIEQRIKDKLLETFSPDVLDVVNESYQHNVPQGSESHFKVIIVSDQFDGKRLLQRHRAVNQCLAQELANDIHALAIHTYTSDEWKETDNVPLSPKCLGGSKFDRG